MTSEELNRMIEMARERGGWRQHSVPDDHLAKVGLDFVINCGNEVHAEFIAASPATIVALAEQLGQAKADWNTQTIIACGYWQELEVVKAELAALKEQTRWRTVAEESPETDTGHWLWLEDKGEPVKVRAVSKSIVVHTDGKMKKAEALGWARGQGFWRMALQSDLWQPAPQPPVEPTTHA